MFSVCTALASHSWCIPASQPVSQDGQWIHNTDGNKAITERVNELMNASKEVANVGCAYLRGH